MLAVDVDEDLWARIQPALEVLSNVVNNGGLEVLNDVVNNRRTVFQFKYCGLTKNKRA